jgi:hypothetical protein
MDQIIPEEIVQIGARPRDGLFPLRQHQPHPEQFVRSTDIADRPHRHTRLL